MSGEVVVYLNVRKGCPQLLLTLRHTTSSGIKDNLALLMLRYTTTSPDIKIHHNFSSH
jgi:hypothetical protein